LNGARIVHATLAAAYGLSTPELDQLVRGTVAIKTQLARELLATRQALREAGDALAYAIGAAGAAAAEMESRGYPQYAPNYAKKANTLRQLSALAGEKGA
jgi:hypothetical protein